MEYPPNSRKLRENDDEQTSKKVEPEKKVKQVTTGEVVRKKKSPIRRFKEMFVGGDARTVWQYVAFDVLLPAAKDMISDAGSQGLERMLFGESTQSRRRGRHGGPSGYVSYNRMSQSRRPPWDREDRREISRRARSSHDFDEIILETRAEAEEVIDQLFELVSKYEQATVADLYGLTGITGNYTDEKWGWTDIRGAGVTRLRDGYLLDLPRPEPLD